MLEEVRVQLFIGERHVGLNIVREFDDFKLHAFFGEHGLGGLQNIGVRHGGSADFEYAVLSAAV